MIPAQLLASLLAALPLVSPVNTGGAAELDPKDGPDVDLRVAIEDDEVRLAIITNLAFLDETCDVQREIPTVLDEVEAPAAMEALFELFKERNGITIDGAVVQPLPARLETDFEVDPGDPSLAPHFVRFGARAVAKTRLTMRYPVKSAPERVGIQWGVYPPNYALEEATGEAPPIEIICRLAANGVERIVQLTAAEPEFIWHRESEGGRARFAEVPALERQEEPPFPWLPAGGAAAAIVAALLGPRGLRRGLFGPLAVALVAYTAVAHARRPVQLPETDEALAIFEPLHENIYRAFDYTDESDVYDALAQSVEGGLLETLYDDVYRSLVMQEEGGAVSRVQEVRHTSLEVETVGVDPEDGRPGFVVNALWEVDGVVFHWGHAHSRTNEYRARYAVRGAEAGWRIATSEVLEQRRVDAKPLDDLEFSNESGWSGFGTEPADGELMEEY